MIFIEITNSDGSTITFDDSEYGRNIVYTPSAYSNYGYSIDKEKLFKLINDNIDLIKSEE